MTAPTRLDELASWAQERIGPALEQRRLGDALARASLEAQRAERRADRLESLTGSARALRLHLKRNALERLRTVGGDLRRLARDVATAQSRDDFDRLASKLEAQLVPAEQEVERALLVEWNRLCQEGLKDQQARKVAVARLPALATIRRRIEDYEEHVRAAERDFPPADPIGTLDTLRDARHTVEKEFDRSGLSAEVLSFLRRAASSSGVDLDALTPEVEGWLKVQGVWKSLRIRFNSVG
jgi:hypothetical protein